MASDERQALAPGVQPDAAEHAPDAVLRDPNPTPLLPGQFGTDAPGTESRMGEAEGHDPLLQVGADLVRHPRTPALSHPQRLKAPAVDLALVAVVGRVVDPHRAACSPDPDLRCE